MTEGKVSLDIEDTIATITFSHPKGNSLPGSMLKQLTDAVTGASDYPNLRVLILCSSGDSVFCAGASIDELLALKSLEEGTAFFMGFATLLLAMRSCPIPIVARVQGKAVGGGVGILAGADYVLATSSASIRLSELAIGLGPYVIEPAITRKIGRAHTATLALGTDWQNADWARATGLFNDVFSDHSELDAGVAALSQQFSGITREALSSLKQTLWEGTSDWTRLLPVRAEESARLTLLESTQQNLHRFFAQKQNGATQV